MDSSLIANFLPIVLLIGVFYVLMIRPQQVQARKTKEMREAVKQNDVVLLSSGFEARVRHVDDGMLTVEIGMENKIDAKVAKDAVFTNITANERAAEEKKKADEEKAAQKAKK